ncbi:Nif3-like dinuclear metal center hexameric protein [Lentzea californiensis]|uniref:Nif3-like dinuclear metal center hexameric protein n=1 Tax=Lentzea californiensis TaxID=438851 RepID=UPI002164B752|nr:Nif3-like dinuclear metal center hexameric protein [Lentzea californiensis]MCR3748123.1 dinuclear metal center protein, YbgI/SA1388 family [Lentzea californiensis]
MKLADVISVLESAYPPNTAEKWDAVGLVCGDPQEEVARVLVCVDPTSSTVDEAVERGAQLVLAHHPLLLKGVNGVPADDPKGALVHKLIRNGAALYCAHTNADSASPGVSDALAKAIGLTVTGPLEAALTEDTGIGRIGELPEAEPLRAFAQRVADALPVTVQGVRAAGDPERMVKRVAVCGGAGDGFLDAVKRAGVDAYVTADLRHHPASEHVESGGPALVDVAHWASEWPWCEQAAEILRSAFGGRVDVLVSTRRTDPWTVGATSTAVGGHA